MYNICYKYIQPQSQLCKFYAVEGEIYGWMDRLWKDMRFQGVDNEIKMSGRSRQELVFCDHNTVFISEATIHTDVK